MAGRCMLASRCPARASCTRRVQLTSNALLPVLLNDVYDVVLMIFFC
jgi:hypothetical protein